MIDFHIYSNIVEAQHLGLKIKIHADRIHEAQKRIEMVKGQGESKAKQLLQLEQSIIQARQNLALKEKDLAQVSGRLTKAKDRVRELKNQAQVNATEKEIASLLTQKDGLETYIFKLLEQTEEWDKEKKQLQEFQKGFASSLNDIHQEVDSEIQKEKKEIDHYQLRIKNLLENCPHNLRELYGRLQNKYPYHSPATFVRDKSCGSCFITICGKQMECINKGLSVETCPGCSRLLLPSTLDTAH